MNNKDLDQIINTFNIRNYKPSYIQKTSYEYMDIDTYNRPTSTSVQVQAEEVYEITVDEKFLNLLHAYLKYAEYHSLYNFTPQPRDLYESSVSANDAYTEYLEDKKLQEKYPELAEIKKDYDIMKALVLKK